MDQGHSIDKRAAVAIKAPTVPGVAGPPVDWVADGPHAPPAFPVVGIGASAGGLAAFKAFFAGISGSTCAGMAFVLVQHLAPEHKSVLAELVGRFTKLPVHEVQDGIAVEPDNVYVVPPGRDLAYLNGTLHLLEPTQPHGHRLPIDFFFRSLALDLRERAIVIVLSGTGSDGTQGVRAVKAEGGMAMVQSAGSAEFDGMPRSALASGLVDYELSPPEMPAKLSAYVANVFGQLPFASSGSAPPDDAMLSKVFVLLRAHTGHDFSRYKRGTIQRRVERRLAIHGIDGMSHYVAYLQKTPSEADALFRDMLIGVTSFFRDAQAFQALEAQVIPQILASRIEDAPIRVWVTGCSTGEEAYSIAILLHERLEGLEQRPLVQVFASDIDARAVAIARTGRFPMSIAADVSAQRLSKHFTAEPDGSGFVIGKSVRDMLIFSEQDVIRDPPFSKLDLLCCRNLLIYMGSELQKQLVLMFHAALNPGGFLFLGSSETVGEFDDLFAAQDREFKLYQRKQPLQGRQPATAGRLVAPLPAASQPPMQRVARVATVMRPSLRELTEQAILRQLSPLGALVTSAGDVLYLQGRTGLFLEPAPGETGRSNILKMARKGLQLALATALSRSSKCHAVVHCPGLMVKSNNHDVVVDLSVSPVLPEAAVPLEPPVYLVLLSQSTAAGSAPIASAARAGVDAGVASAFDAAEQIEKLQHELREQEDYLRSINEELEATNDELLTANERAQSVNEELQSSNEELETSKEELQSLNEELATVNTELRTKVIDLSRANNDMNNLLAGTGIATVFVDQGLRILRFTPAASDIINLIQSDVGRQVAHIVSNLVGYDRLVEDARSVLESLIPREVDVQTTRGHWYTMRIQPYRTLNNVIEGAVITFVDITDVVRTRDALHKANKLMRLAVVVHDAHDAITVQDLEGQTLAWNPGAVRMYGWSEAEALAMNVRERIPQELREEALATMRRLSRAEVLSPYPARRMTKAGAVLNVSMVSTALVNATGKMYAIATTERAPDAAMID